jgi:hypothetical protein
MESASPPVSPSVVALILMIQKASVTAGPLAHHRGLIHRYGIPVGGGEKVKT